MSAVFSEHSVNYIVEYLRSHILIHDKGFIN